LWHVQAESPELGRDKRYLTEHTENTEEKRAIVIIYVYSVGLVGVKDKPPYGMLWHAQGPVDLIYK
jgi:hypothetical protein